MNMLLKMLLFAILMILGFSAILIGAMLLSIGRADDFMMALIALIAGVVAGPGSLYMVIRLNSDFQDEALKEVLKDPKRILFRFLHSDKESEIIIANDALFVGKRHYPFKSAYENLVALRQEKDTIIFSFEAGIAGKKITRFVEIEVPTKLSTETSLWVENMQNKPSV